MYMPLTEPQLHGLKTAPCRAQNRALAGALTAPIRNLYNVHSTQKCVT